MDNLDASGIESGCKEILNAFKGSLAWKWDNRFETVLAEFGVDKKDDIQEMLGRYLSFTWDSSNIGNAPHTVQTINNHLGRLRAGQLLLTSDPNGNILIYCAWWPWGNGKTISIRIAPSFKQSLDSERVEKIRLFRGWFGI